MNIPPISNLWRLMLKREPLVPKVAKMSESEHLLGSDDTSRETSDYSDRKKSEAMLYDGKGKTHNLDDDNHPKIDERM